MVAVGVWRQGWLLLGVVGLMAWSGALRADDVLEWLNRASEGARKLNYSGIYVYYHGEHTEVMRVLHRAEPKGELEKVEVLDDNPRQFLRVNSDVYCHLPDGKHVRLERNVTRRFFPAFLPDQPGDLLKYYDAKLGGTERVAGHTCQVITLEPRDGYRYAYYLWLDKRTGLPLKSRMVNGNGAAVSTFMFSEVQIGKAPEIQLFKNDLAGKHILRASLDKPSSVAWEVTPPPGFRQVQEAVRFLPGKESPVTHLVFSDGLSVLSMFVEPAGPDRQGLQGLSAEGAIGVYGRQIDGFTVTTLGEVPNMALIETGDSVRKK